MAYTWKQGEDITAAKLNASQTDPLLKAVNHSGVKGGVESSALNSETINCDIGTGAAKSIAKDITEHELGNIHYEYDEANNRWAMRSGSPGVTGKVSSSPGELKWRIDVPDAKQVNWQRITTDKWGNVISSAQIIDGGSHATVMWEPKNDQGGTIWRRLGTIEADSQFNVPPGKEGTPMTWKYSAVNENNTLILPVPRQDGWDHRSTINVCTASDVSPRIPTSSWIQTAGPDTGASVPIQGVGELGGIFAYQARDNEGNNVGIGLASGVEFYDENTIACRNTSFTRPNGTTARVDFGTNAKHGFIQIASINPRHPWQFELTGHLDIGSGGGCFDPGTQWFKEKIIEGVIPPAHSFLKGSGMSALTISQPGLRGYYYDPGSQDGIITGRVIRGEAVILDRVSWSVLNSEGADALPGMVNNGDIIIGSAQQMWACPNPGLGPIQNCTMLINSNGGLIMGVIPDMDGDNDEFRPYIDKLGFIHTLSPTGIAKTTDKAHWYESGDPASWNKPGVIEQIHACADCRCHHIFDGDIVIAGAQYCDGSGLKQNTGVIRSVSMVCSTCSPRIINGDIKIPKSTYDCLAYYNPNGQVSKQGLVNKIQWSDTETWINNGDIILGTARWANDMNDRTGGISAIDEVDCDTWIENGAIHLATANDNEGSSQRTGLIRSISVDPGTGFICNGTIFVHVDPGTGGSPSVCKANYNPLYPQFNKAGIISSVGWCDNYDQINQGSIYMATANWDIGTGGWNIPQRTGGIKGICWGVNRNQPAIDNGNLIMPVATYYPCESMAPAGVKNRPGLIRGVVAVDWLLPAPYIDECGILHLRA